MAEVVWTLEAIDDLEAIGAFYERTSPSYAAYIVERLFSAVTLLAEHPRMGRMVPEIDNDLIQELIVEHYRVVYRLMHDRVEVITVLHTRENLSRRI